jgi:hypothetical protein
VAAVSKDDVWFAGPGNFARWDGSQLKPMPFDKQGKANERIGINSLAVRASDDAWAVGYSYQEGVSQLLTLHWDGKTWSTVDTPDMPPNNFEPSANASGYYTSLRAVYIISENDAWAVGTYAENKTVRTITLHWNNVEWKTVPSPNANSFDGHLYSVVALASDDVWAFGDSSTYGAAQPLAIHWNGKSWELVNNLDPQRLWQGVNNAAITSTKDVWLVSGVSPLGSAVKKVGSIHWEYASMPEVHFPALFSVSALSSDDVWAVGYKWSGYPSHANKNTQRNERTLVMHWDGKEWLEIPGPDPSYIQSLDSVAVAAKNDVWVVGYSAWDEDSASRPMTAHFVGCPNSGGKQ